MDFPLSSSLVLVVTVALWMVWVAPYVLRNRRQQVLTASLPVEAFTDEPNQPHPGVVLTLAPQQEKPMETMHGKAQASPTDSGAAGMSRKKLAADPFSIRYARFTIALAGLALLLTAIVSGVLRVLGTGSAWVPVLSLFGAVIAVVILRRLALKDRRARRAVRPAPVQSPAWIRREETPAVPKETTVFDAEAGRKEPARLSASELREAALAVALAAGDKPEEVTRDAKGASWEPVEVPKPTYVDAAKASRPAPEPLDLPESPKPVGKPVLKQGAEQAEAAVAAQASVTAKGSSALSNLDSVLQRRRA
ncbi:hypothetical protein [Arthrobacter sp. efr-133-TYG-104]|uniref:hypothetical protein n=1 Tax=Arthrobacter sp. efr-133-TYG-104 TaxID=3040324 RepID=UPI00254B1594|nr:hypothetical protein [Arthrobacter sp. efr-133-TYG-104]